METELDFVTRVNKDYCDLFLTNFYILIAVERNKNFKNYSFDHNFTIVIPILVSHSKSTFEIEIEGLHIVGSCKI